MYVYWAATMCQAQNAFLDLGQIWLSGQWKITALGKQRKTQHVGQLEYSKVSLWTKIFMEFSTFYFPTLNNGCSKLPRNWKPKEHLHTYATCISLIPFTHPLVQNLWKLLLCAISVYYWNTSYYWNIIYSTLSIQRTLPWDRDTENTCI